METYTYEKICDKYKTYIIKDFKPIESVGWYKFKTTEERFKENLRKVIDLL